MRLGNSLQGLLTEQITFKSGGIIYDNITA